MVKGLEYRRVSGFRGFWVFRALGLGFGVEACRLGVQNRVG